MKYFLLLITLCFSLSGFSQTYTVVLDAGHGGTDTGSTNDSSTMNESSINYWMAEYVRKFLSAKDAKIIQTRKGENETVSLEKRVEIISNDVPDIIISFHVNNSDDPNKNGFECIVGTDTNANTTAATKLSGYISKALSSTLTDNGISKNDLYLIKNTKVPVVYIELGYMSNENDVNIITDLTNQISMAESLANQIALYLETLGKEKVEEKPNTEERPTIDR